MQIPQARRWPDDVLVVCGVTLAQVALLTLLTPGPAGLRFRDRWIPSKSAGVSITVPETSINDTAKLGAEASRCMEQAQARRRQG